MTLETFIWNTTKLQFCQILCYVPENVFVNVLENVFGKWSVDITKI